MPSRRSRSGSRASSNGRCSTPKPPRKARWMIGDILVSLYDESESHGSYFLKKAGITRLDLLETVSHGLFSKRIHRRRAKEEEPDEEERSRVRPGGRETGKKAVQRSARRVHDQADAGSPRKKESSNRSSAGRICWSGPSRCSAAGSRTTRFMSEIPGSERPRSPRARAADRRR